MDYLPGREQPMKDSSESWRQKRPLSREFLVDAARRDTVEPRNHAAQPGCVQHPATNAPGSEWESYDRTFFEKIAAIEDRHFWFCARRRVVRAALQPIINKLPDGYRVLELGCGTGGILAELTSVCRRGEVIGMDLYPEAAAFAKQRAACQVIVGNIVNPPDIGKFHVIGMFDVLEHLPNDRRILSTVNHMLHDRGVLVLTVPAHMMLWSYFDVPARHYRRYESPQLVRVLGEAGFTVEYVTEFMVGIFPLFWLMRRIVGDKTAAGSSPADKAAYELKVVPVINEILKLVLAWEPLAVRRRWQLPLGTSLLAIAHKQS
jgi:SAM-dependent methyltransferase